MTTILKFAETAAAVDQVARELYYEPLATVTARKYADFRGHLRGQGGEMASLLALTADQIAEAVKADMTVRAIKATMVEASDVLGGYLVPEQYHAEVLMRLRPRAVVRRYARVRGAISDSMQLPKATGGSATTAGAASVTWLTHEIPTSAPSTSLSFGAVRMPIATALLSIDMSMPLVEDGGSLLEDHLSAILADTFAPDEDKRFLVGDGPAQTPTGIVPGGTNAWNITTQSSGSAAALTAAGLLATPFNVAPQHRRGASCCWVMSTSTLKAVALLVDGNGRPLLDMAGAEARGGAPLLGGFVVEEVADTVMPAIAAGAFPALFGDISGYVIGERLGLSIDRYSDSTTARTNSVSFVARRRIGGLVAQPERFALVKVSA